METKIFNQENISELVMFTKALEKHVVDGGTIIFPQVKGRYDVSKKFASSKEHMANSYLTEISNDIKKEVTDPLTVPCVMVLVPAKG